MRIIIMSDSHKNAANVRRIVEKHSNADLFLHLGDGENEFLEIMRQYPDAKHLHVCGNCDFYSGAEQLNLIRVGGKKIFFTHGHIYNVKYGINELLYAAQGRGADVVLYGHTHIAQSDYFDGLYAVNPGSCSGSGNAPTYAILDITTAGIVPVIVSLGQLASP